MSFRMLICVLLFAAPASAQLYDKKAAPTESAPLPKPAEVRTLTATPERADESRPSRPYRAVDTLAAMERRGSITAGMRQAGEDFRARFAVAQLDPLCAPDLSRPRESGGHCWDWAKRLDFEG